jgi:hypothetical protein
MLLALASAGLENLLGVKDMRSPAFGKFSTKGRSPRDRFKHIFTAATQSAPAFNAPVADRSSVCFSSSSDMVGDTVTVRRRTDSAKVLVTL